MSNQSAILTESDFRAAVSEQCGFGDLKHQIETGVYDPSNAELEIKLGNDIGFAGRHIQIEDRDCDDACQYSPDGKERPANDPEDLETWQYLSERQGVE